MKKHLFLTALLSSLSMVSCNDDPVKEDAPPVILPMKITYTGHGEKETITYKYDSQNRLTDIKSFVGNRWLSTTFTYDNESLIHVDLEEYTGYKCNYNVSYKGNTVFVEYVSLFPEYPNNPRKHCDTLTLDSDKHFLNIETSHGKKYNFSYDDKGNAIRLSDLAFDMVYDTKNGMFNNVKTDPWVFIYFLYIRTSYFYDAFNYNNNCTQFRSRSGAYQFDINYKITYNKDDYPFKIYGDDETSRIIEYSTTE